MKLAVVITHPIRFFVPLLRLLQQRGVVQLKLFYTLGQHLLTSPQYNPATAAEHEPALQPFDGYEYELVQNTADKPSSNHYHGIINPELIDAVSKWNPDAILVCGWKFRSHLQLMRHFKGKIPVHFRGDSTLLEEVHYHPLKKFLRRLFLRWVYRYVDVAWYVGSENKRYYEAFGKKESELVYVPHVTDNSRFARTASAQAHRLAFRSARGIKETDIVFLFAGQMIPRKQVIALLHAFLAVESENVHLLFVGQGPQLATLKNQSVNNPRVHFLSRQSQTSMPNVYAIADVLILPSLIDTWGLVINEAMAGGLVIIASDQCGAAHDLVEQGVNGFVFPYRDTSALTVIMRMLASDANQFHSMREASLRKIADWNFEEAATAIENIFK